MSGQRRTAPLLAFVAFVAAASTGCADAPAADFPEWTLALPEGTPVHEYGFVPFDERTESLGLERDLVIREGLGRGLYNPGAVAIGDEGTIFVLDSGNHRIVAFDQDGAALREFGREGQGPGELQRPWGFGVAGDRVVVTDLGSSRITVFNTAGELHTDRQFEDLFWGQTIAGFGDDLLIIDAQRPPLSPRDQPVTVPWVLGRFSERGDLISAYIELEASGKAYFYSSAMMGLLDMTFANPIGVLRGDGTAYVTTADQYQVYAVRPDGSMAWALRASLATTTPTETQKDEMLGRFRELTARPDLSADMADAKVVWASRFAALENIETDARGRLYAFPYRYRPPDTTPDAAHPVAVDVYSPDGARLFNGLAPLNAWDAAYGEHVFRLEDDTETGERVLARYRITNRFR